MHPPPFPPSLQANAAYAAGFTKGGLALPPAKRAAMLVCMDARIVPAAAFGLAEGDVHVIRNAGGRASDDAIRSLVISHKLLGTSEFYVVHHTDCGMQYFTDAQLAALLEGSLATAAIVPTADGVDFKNVTSEGGSPDGKYVAWLAFKDLEGSVREDVARIRAHALVDKAVPIHGYIYDVKSGKLAHVVTAA